MTGGRIARRGYTSYCLPLRPAYNWLPGGAVPLGDLERGTLPSKLNWLRRWRDYYRAIATLSELVGHTCLSADRTLQQVEFANGVRATFDMAANKLRVENVPGFSGAWEQPEQLGVVAGASGRRGSGAWHPTIPQTRLDRSSDSGIGGAAPGHAARCSDNGGTPHHVGDHQDTHWEEQSGPPRIAACACSRHGDRPADTGASRE